ncbi:hypothetical protein NA57DRAFT_75349 [Rhizodiscina lignyota]|uniref:Uncharacterized protein n=1 Tax=Rhizodiscina lignyota TaxID=1504668 RepID=A0A9P4IDZ3_9PEZI|nr:hypothetical protein NA57DRAFT_75349 [Rhizodiscina lignyota]
MAPNSRNDPNLRRRIARLRLPLRTDSQSKISKRKELKSTIDLLKSRLHPLYPQPIGGAPHPKFPKTIIHWLLLTEDELDSIAHYYGQSTPNKYTNKYPAPMGWDKEFLAKPDVISPQLMPWDEDWLVQFGSGRQDSLNSNSCASTPNQISSTCAEFSSLTTSEAASETLSSPQSTFGDHNTGSNHRRHRHPPIVGTAMPEADPPYPVTPKALTTKERVCIKRRKLGKFMGLRGCETPVAEMELRVRFLEAKLGRAIRGALNEPSIDDWSPRSKRPSFGKGLL